MGNQYYKYKRNEKYFVENANQSHVPGNHGNRGPNLTWFKTQVLNTYEREGIFPKKTEPWDRPRDRVIRPRLTRVFSFVALPVVSGLCTSLGMPSSHMKYMRKN